MLKVHYYSPNDDEDYDTVCGRSYSSVRRLTEKIEETTCTTCLKRLHEGAIWAMRHHEQEAIVAEDRLSAVIEQQWRLENP